MSIRYLLIIIVIGLVFIAAKKDTTKEFSLKKFEKTLVMVENNLYASKYEVSNLLYTTFLQELKSENKIKEFAIAKIDSLGWNNQALVELYHTHAAYLQYPVVNISYEGANLFCEWLTKKYNVYPKRKFKKVKFRLPTQDEWEKAAYGTLSLIKYPWGGSYLRNAKGCVMANFKIIGDEKIHYDTIKKKLVVVGENNVEYPKSKFKAPRNKDKKNQKPNKIILFSNDESCNNTYITSPVTSFTENSIGIYNMSGNVAEMVAEKGIVRGGGWNSSGYDIRIKSVSNYNKAMSDIGFRCFVDIIDK